MASRRNRNSSRYLGTITQADLDRAAANTQPANGANDTDKDDDR